MEVIRRILCNVFGIHSWEYVVDNKIFPYTPYAYCKHCGKINCKF